MYNNSSETIPLKTLVHLQVILRPWFDNKSLQEGLNLIREGKVHALLKRKQEMSNSLISTDESGVIKKLDRGQLKELFRLD